MVEYKGPSYEEKHADMFRNPEQETQEPKPQAPASLEELLAPQPRQPIWPYVVAGVAIIAALLAGSYVLDRYLRDNSRGLVPKASEFKAR